MNTSAPATEAGSQRVARTPRRARAAHAQHAFHRAYYSSTAAQNRYERPWVIPGVSPTTPSRSLSPPTHTPERSRRTSAGVRSGRQVMCGALSAWLHCLATAPRARRRDRRRRRLPHPGGPPHRLNPDSVRRLRSGSPSSAPIHRNIAAGLAAIRRHAQNQGVSRPYPPAGRDCAVDHGPLTLGAPRR